MQREQIEVVVLNVLRTLVPKGQSIRLEDRLIDDLKLLSDDATQMALDLQRHFNIKLPLSAWETVYTVQDVVDLLLKTLRHKEQ